MLFRSEFTIRLPQHLTPSCAFGRRLMGLALLATLILGPRAGLAGPLDVLSSGPAPVLGGMASSTAGPSSQSGSGGPGAYTHITSTDVADPNRFWYTNRPNIFNQRVPDNWDAMKLINTDRPDFTDVATVVGKGVTQIETGYTYDDRYDHTSSTWTQTNTVPESLLRYGTSDRFEWRMKWLGGYTNVRTQDNANNIGATQQGLSDFTLGFKWIVFQQENWRPLQTIVTRLGVPAGSTNFSADTIQPGISYIYNWQVRKWWFTRASTGVDWIRGPELISNPAMTNPVMPAYFNLSQDSSVQGFQSWSNYFQISKRLGMFAEYYVVFHKGAADNRPANFHDYGWYIYASPNLQFDIRIGQRLEHSVSEFFTGAGVSTRF